MANFVVTYPFDNSSEYEKVNTEISAGKGRLSLTDNTGETFNQPFTSDSGFTYDSAKAEFVAGQVQQKDQRPTDAIFGAQLYISKDGNWGEGGLTSTLFENAVISNGYMDTSDNLKSCWKNLDSDNYDLGQTGTIKFKFKCLFSSLPSFRYLFSCGNSSGSARIYSYINTNGAVTLRMTGDGDVSIMTLNTSPLTWTLNQEYEISFDYNINDLGGGLGLTNLFLNGTSIASSTAIGTRTETPNQLVIGNIEETVSSGVDGAFKDLIVLSTAQHTANYTPGYTVAEDIFAASKVELPQFSYSNIGNLQAFTAFAVTDSNSPKYILNDLYYNSGWASSDGSYAQANSSAEVIANIASLPASDTLDIDIAFDDGNSQMSVDDLTATYTGQQYYTSGSIVTGEISAEDFISFISTEINTANTTITYAVYVNGSLYYYNGSAWVNSNGLFAQTNTAAEMNTNLPTLLSAPSTTKFYILISTSDQQETGEIDIITSSYEFVGESTDLTTCVVWGYYKDISGNPVSGATVTFKLVRNSSEYKEASNNVIEKSNSTTTDSTGYFELPLIRSSEYEGSAVYTITITKQSDQLSTTKTNEGAALEFIVPDELDKNITDIFTAS